MNLYVPCTCFEAHFMNFSNIYRAILFCPGSLGKSCQNKIHMFDIQIEKNRKIHGAAILLEEGMVNIWSRMNSVEVICNFVFLTVDLRLQV